jgi:threonine dehydratase
MEKGAHMRGQKLEPVTWEDVQKAYRRIRERFGPSPLVATEFLKRILGHNIQLKAESMNPTGAFKIRGAYNKISCLMEEREVRRVVTASSGNHALGVSLASYWKGIEATVCVPGPTPEVKKRNCIDFGATVIPVGEIYDDAYTHAQELCENEGMLYIHPVADTDVVAGQGTISVEILEQNPNVEQVIVPLGGGGLASGIAFAMKHAKSSVRIVAVQAAGSPLFYRCLEAGKLVELEHVDTIADGMACKKAEPYLLDMVKKYVDDVVVVAEETIAEAIRVCLLDGKLLLEGAGASATAAVIEGKVKVDCNTVIIASGGNIDPSLLKSILEE